MYEEHLYWYAAVLQPTKRDVTGVVDGDTVHATLDMGDFIYRQKPLRLFGINAPEMSTEAGKISKAYSINWFQLHCAKGSFIMRSNGLDPEDKYGRLLATIYAPGGECLNDDLVNAGMAVRQKY
jgi:endonuclease YncB( thermonuclease family)